MDSRGSNPQFWLDQVFLVKAVEKAGVVRRNSTWVSKEIDRVLFVGEVRRRGFHLLEIGDQLIVICHSDPVRMHF